MVDNFGVWVLMPESEYFPFFEFSTNYGYIVYLFSHDPRQLHNPVQPLIVDNLC